MGNGAAETKLLDILKCSRPVLFANADRESPFSTGGTAFVVAFRNRCFVVTAEHVLNFKSFRPDQFCVQYRPDARDFLPLGAHYLLSGFDADDTDQYQVAVWDVDEEHLRPELFGEHHPYRLLQMDCLTLFGPGSDYLYRGFPTCERDYNQETRTMHQSSVAGRAQYVGPTAYAYLHEVRLMRLDALRSLDGLSGSPMFQVTHDDQKYSVKRLPGCCGAERGNRSELTYLGIDASLKCSLESAMA